MKKGNGKMDFALSFEDLREVTFGRFKYVQIDTGEYRFLSIEKIFHCHANLVKEGEQAISAGEIVIRDNRFFIDGYYSETLKLGSIDGDEERLAEGLGIEHKDPYSI